jgi:hypothetical protein
MNRVPEEAFGPDAAIPAAPLDTFPQAARNEPPRMLMRA